MGRLYVFTEFERIMAEPCDAETETPSLQRDAAENFGTAASPFHWTIVTGHRSSNMTPHQPRGLKRCTQRVVQSVCAEAILAARNQEDRLEP